MRTSSFCVLVLFLVGLGLRRCPKAFSGYSKRGPLCCGADFSLVASPVADHGLQGTLVAGPGLWSTGSMVLVQGLQLLLSSPVRDQTRASAGRFFPIELPGKLQEPQVLCTYSVKLTLTDFLG